MNTPWAPEDKRAGQLSPLGEVFAHTDLERMRDALRRIVNRARVCLTLPAAVAIHDEDMRTLRSLAGMR